MSSGISVTGNRVVDLAVTTRQWLPNTAEVFGLKTGSFGTQNLPFPLVIGLLYLFSQFSLCNGERHAERVTLPDIYSILYRLLVI